METFGQSRTVKPGEWNGETARATVTKTSVRFDFGCSAGNVDSPLRIDKNGDFRVKGTYVYTPGTPLPPGVPPAEAQEVFFVGTIKGNKMSLSIDFPNSERPSPTYELVFGTSHKDIPRCS
jgi:hypothetical protein